MKYYKYKDEESFIGVGIRYVEADEKGWSLREVTVSDGVFLGSNIKYPHWGLCMAEGAIEDDVFIDAPNEFQLRKIDKQSFEEVWSELLKQNLARWITTKLAYKIGSKVKGQICIFYPQGVIVDFGDCVLGVADYSACKASANGQSIYPKHIVHATISGFDEQNQWLVLSNPQVEI